MLSKRYFIVRKQRLLIEVSKVNENGIIVEFTNQIDDKCQGWGVVET